MESYVPEERIAVDENVNAVAISTMSFEESANRDIGNELMMHTAQKTLKSGFWLVLNLIIHPVGAFGLFSSAAMLIGIILVCCYTISKSSVQKCELKFNRTAPNPIEYKYDPRSVAIGDFNNDTWFDMVIANSAVHSITVTFGYNNVTFGSPIIYSTGSGSAPYMVIVNDVNNDHRLDIAVANFGTNNVGIFLGFGNGSFGDQRKRSTGPSRPISISIAHFNNDTLLDIVTANYGTHSISIFYGRGNGNFANPVTYSTGYDSLPLSLAAGDFNNDSYMDIAVANYGISTVGILFGNPDGTFENQISFSTGFNSHPSSIAVGHINNDIFLDIVVANYGTRNIGVILGDGNRSFANQMTYAIEKASPYSVGIGDFNQDNKMDLVVTNQGLNNIAVLLGSDNDTFASLIIYYSTGSSSSIMCTIGDLNKDNRLDILVVNNDTGAIDILLGDFEGFANPITYSTDSNPQSVAVGDFNNDSRLDIVVTNSASNNVSVLLGNGDGSFANQTMYSTGSSPQSVAVGDFNNDSRLDIVVTNRDNDSVSVLLGNDDGSFANQITYSTGFSPQSVAVGDFNNDSRLDIVVANSVSNNVSVLLGNGDGSFANQTMYSTGSTPQSVAVSDFNNDSRLDIVVVNFVNNTVSVLLGNGDGSFANQTMYSTGSTPQSVAVGDFNNDSRLDIVVANYVNNDVSVLLGNGDGSFANQTKYSTGSYPQSVAVGDFNNDSRLDIVVVNSASNNVSVLLGNGDGSFADQITYSTGSSPQSVAVGDFNNDSRLDIVVTNHDNDSVSMLFQYNRGALTKQGTYASGGGSNLRYVAVSDLNNDARLDIIVANFGTDDVHVLFGLGNGTFLSPKLLVSGSNSHPSSIAIADYNGDMHRDIAVTNYGTKSVDMMLGNGKGSFATQTDVGFRFVMSPFLIGAGDFNNDRRSEIVVAYDGNDNVDILLAYDTAPFTRPVSYSTGSGSNPYFVAVGDFNNDSRLDIVVANSYSDNIGVHLGNGNASFADPITYSTGFRPQFVVVGDFNNDSRLDIVVTNSASNNVSVLLGNGDGSFANQTMYSTGSSPQSVAVGDFNNDSHLDIVVTNLWSSNVSVLLGNGDGSFAYQITFSTSSTPWSVAVGDFNNDSRLDIVVTNSGSDNLSVLLGNGDGSFANQTMYSTGSTPQSVAVGDFNNDSHLDIVVTNSGSANVSVLLGNGDGSFANQTMYSTGSSPQSVAVGDFNKDSRLDIVVANFDSDTVGVLLGNGDGSFANQTKYPTQSGPQSVAVGDFNNDSRLDIVVAIFRSDTVSVFLGYFNEAFAPQTMLITGNYSRPQSFAIADFNNDSRMDVVVANSGAQNIGVFIGYGNISFANQVTYSTDLYSSPYSVAVADFNNDNRLDIVVANYVTDNVGIFLGFGNGSFTNQKTYPTGSDSRPYSVAVADFNNDTLLDILVANYKSNNQGVFLGYGDGTFAKFLIVVSNYGSHPFSVVVGDFNGDKKTDFAEANNGTDSLSMFLQTC